MNIKRTQYVNSGISLQSEFRGNFEKSEQDEGRITHTCLFVSVSESFISVIKANTEISFSIRLAICNEMQVFKNSS
jgi:hypothetical protein